MSWPNPRTSTRRRPHSVRRAAAWRCWPASWLWRRWPSAATSIGGWFGRATTPSRRVWQHCKAEVARERDERAASDEAARAEREQLAADLAAQVQVLAATRAALAARPTASDSAPAPAAPRDWQLAEVEYLLRLANHRVRLERDADGATDLLTAADETLARLDDFAFHEVRALLAEETASLRAFEGADVAGVFLRLEAAKGLIDQLPLRLPAYAGEASAYAGEAAYAAYAGEAGTEGRRSRRRAGGCHIAGRRALVRRSVARPRRRPGPLSAP